MRRGSRFRLANGTSVGDGEGVMVDAVACVCAMAVPILAADGEQPASIIAKITAKPGSGL